MDDQTKQRMIEAASTHVGMLSAIKVMQAIEPIIDAYVEEQLEGTQQWLARPSGEVGD